VEASSAILVEVEFFTCHCTGLHAIIVKSIKKYIPLRIIKLSFIVSESTNFVLNIKGINYKLVYLWPLKISQYNMITIILIALTAVISYIAFSNNQLVDKLIFYPPEIKKKQWYRFVSYGFLHADLSHLAFNMFALYLFGTEIEKVFKEVFGVEVGSFLYILLYFLGLIFSILPTWFKEKDNYYYRSLGASGAVSAVVFAYILVYPMNFMGILFIPIFLPAFLFGIIYVVTSIYLEKMQNGNINHLAHVAGGVFGIVFMIVTFMFIADINIIRYFIESIQINSFSDLIHFGY
jgi:membrane associated rhomboid family serine protease